MDYNSLLSAPISWELKSEAVVSTAVVLKLIISHLNAVVYTFFTFSNDYFKHDKAPVNKENIWQIC